VTTQDYAGLLELAILWVSQGGRACDLVGSGNCNTTTVSFDVDYELVISLQSEIQVVVAHQAGPLST
jgi:hypothetical protein